MSTKEVLANMAEDAIDALPIPNDADLALVSSLVQRQRYLEAQVLLFEDQLNQAKKNLVEVQEKFLPEALAKFGLSELVMLDGSRVVVKPETFASILKKNEKEAYDWLKENGFGDIIKEEVLVSLTKGTSGGEEVAKLLDEHGFSYQRGQSVHYQTLRAWAREQLERGVVPPENLFSVFVKKVAKILKPR